MPTMVRKAIYEILSAIRYKHICIYIMNDFPENGNFFFPFYKPEETFLFSNNICNATVKILEGR